MIIQFTLVTLLLALAAYALSQRAKAPLVALLMLAVVVVGIGLVLFPEAATHVAHAVGVGRGADLVFYVFLVIALAAIFNLHLQMRRNGEVTTELARAIALLSARRPGGEA
jgi:small membrane protein